MGAKTLNGRYRMESPLAKRADPLRTRWKKKKSTRKTGRPQGLLRPLRPLTTDYSNFALTSSLSATFLGVDEGWSFVEGNADLRPEATTRRTVAGSNTVGTWPWNYTITAHGGG